jgi:adenylate cyclase
MGVVLTSAGRPKEAIPYFHTAMRLDPNYPALFPYYLGLAQFGLEQFADAAASLETAVKLNPDDSFSHLLLGATYGYLGRTPRAASAIARYNDIRVSRGYIPLSIYDAPHLWFFKPADLNRLRDGLRLAGVPDNLFQGEFAKQNRLSADEIRTLLLGQRLHGRTLDFATEHAATITTDGTVTMSGDWGSGDAAISRFENGQFCFKWSTSGLEDCVTLFRNPGGANARENEFVWLGPRGAFTFSQVK